MIKKIYKKIKETELLIAVTCLVISVTIIFISAVCRTVGSPINWAMDISLLLFAWSIFLGADLAYEKGSLVFVDLIIDMFPKRLQTTLNVVSLIIIALFLAMLIYYGFILSVRTWDRAFQGVPAISYTWVTLSVPISAILMLITTILKLKSFQKQKIIGEE